MIKYDNKTVLNTVKSIVEDLPSKRNPENDDGLCYYSTVDASGEDLFDVYVINQDTAHRRCIVGEALYRLGANVPTIECNVGVAELREDDFFKGLISEKAVEFLRLLQSEADHINWNNEGKSWNDLDVEQIWEESLND